MAEEQPAEGQSSLPATVEADVDGGEPQMVETPLGNHRGEEAGTMETSARSTQVRDAAKLKRQVARVTAERAVIEANQLLAAAAEAVSRVEPWTAEQEDALRAAVESHGGRFAEQVSVRQVAATMDWMRVSEEVPGKTKQQCSERWILMNHSSDASADDEESVPSALLTAASEAAASAAGVLLAAAQAAEDERRIQQEGLRLTTPVEARREAQDTAEGDPENLMEYNALVFDALHAKRDSVEKLQAKVRGLQLDIRQLRKDKAQQEAENCEAVKYWEEGMAAKDQALVEMTASRDQVEEKYEKLLSEVRVTSQTQLDTMRERNAETRARLEGDVEKLTEKLQKVQTFRANMEKVEAEVAELRSQLQDLKSERKMKEEAAEREMYEQGIRCNKIVAQARMEGMNIDAVEFALKQRVQKLDKQGNRVGLSQLESLVTLLVDTMRGGRAARIRKKQEPEKVEETRAAEQMQLPRIPAGNREGQAPRHRGRKMAARVKDDTSVEFPLVPMPSSSRTNKESYARWRWQFDGQYGGPGRVRG